MPYGEPGLIAVSASATGQNLLVYHSDAPGLVQATSC